MWNALLKILSTWYFKYELITCQSFCEPWEKKFINGMIITIIALVSYSTYVYLPQYMLSLLSYIDVLKTSDGKLIVDFNSCPTSQI